MTYTPIPAGTLNWDAPVNAALTDQDARITTNEGNIATNAANILPRTNDSSLRMSDYSNVVGWTFAPEEIVTNTTLTSGTLYMSRIMVRTSGVMSMITLASTANAVTPVAGQNFAGVYDASGTLLGQTADQSTSWSTGGPLKEMPITVPFPVAPGSYYVALLGNAATNVNVGREAAISAAAHNWQDLTPATYRLTTGGTGLTGLTSLPANVNMADRAQGGLAWWLAVTS